MINFTELIEIATSDDRVMGLLEQGRDKLAEEFGYQLGRCKNFDQRNPHHCYKVLEHMARTATGIERGELSGEEFENLRIAALFHDIGKPVVAREKKERLIFPDHASASMKIMAQLLTEYGCSDERKKVILFYILFHDAFMLYITEEEPTQNSRTVITAQSVAEKMAEMIKDSESIIGYTPTDRDFLNLMLLCRRDVCAQREILEKEGETKNLKEEKLARIFAVTGFFQIKT